MNNNNANANDSDEDFILFHSDNDDNYEEIINDDSQINFTNLTTNINTPPPPPLYHDTPPSSSVDNSPRVMALGENIRNLQVYVPPPPPPQPQQQQRRAPTPFPTPREPQTPTDFLINQIIDREFEEPLQQQIPERAPAPPDLDELVIQKRIEKIHIAENQRRRRHEKKRFDDWYQTLTLNEYQAQELVQKYNDYFNSNISAKGLGKLRGIKEHFFAGNKMKNKVRITIYRKV